MQYFSPNLRQLNDSLTGKELAAGEEAKMLHAKFFFLIALCHLQSHIQKNCC
jgi:hypothetical protein